MARKLLLLCGILSSLLYIAMTVFVAAEWPGYSSAAQTISELSAVGAPTRSIRVVPAAFYTVLITAFGWGVLQSANGSLPLGVAAWLLLAYGALGLVWPLAPMHAREVLATGGGTMSDTLHLVLGSVTVTLMLLTMTVSAAAFGDGFRFYSFASLAVLIVFGVLTFVDAPRIAANLPTPWIGLWERINIAVFLLWVVVLATLPLRDKIAYHRPHTAIRS